MDVPNDTYYLSGFIEFTKPVWKFLGKLESQIHEEALEDCRIESPIYVAGLARAGTTLCLEFLAEHGETATHQYRDFPMIYTPFIGAQARKKQDAADETPVERAHADGIYVTRKSPEALEEPLWRSFFRSEHQDPNSWILDESTANPKFEEFYQDHIKKILNLRSGKRYVAKGNYNIARIGYLKKLFPDAKFIIPVRHPIGHIASLMKQHRLFTEAQKQNPRVLKHFNRVGHFEFGLGREPVPLGNADQLAHVRDCWANGKETEGWAAYWAYVHEYLWTLLQEDAGLAAASYVLDFETLCDNPRGELQNVLDHVDLEDPTGSRVAAFADRIRKPDYYKAGFTDEQLEIIRAQAEKTAARYGYSL